MQPHQARPSPGHPPCTPLRACEACRSGMQTSTQNTADPVAFCGPRRPPAGVVAQSRGFTARERDLCAWHGVGVGQRRTVERCHGRAAQHARVDERRGAGAGARRARSPSVTAFPAPRSRLCL
eukprot:37897-Chlamydomonas_euryale.AAC.3